MTDVHVLRTRLAVDDAGSGPAVVFCHAGIADRRMWAHQVAALARDHRVIAYDQRGFGDSDPATSEHSHHRDLLAVLDALTVDQAVLVGSSMGGAFAIDAALAAPDRVRGLVLVGSGLSGHTWPPQMCSPLRELVEAVIPPERLTAYQTRTAQDVREEDVVAMAEAQADFMVAGPSRDRADVDPQVWRSALSMLRGVFRRTWSEHPVPESPPVPPAAARLDEIAAPTLVINGLLDVPAIQDLADELTEAIPGAERLDLPSTAHLPPLERPTQVTSALRTFTARLDRPVPTRTEHRPA